jgi:hypothetical protein
MSSTDNPVVPMVLGSGGTFVLVEIHPVAVYFSLAVICIACIVICVHILIRCKKRNISLEKIKTRAIRRYHASINDGDSGTSAKHS